MKSADPDRTPVAKELWTYCTKEKIDTWHVVMFHNAKGIVEKVKCKSCSSEHKYKSAKVKELAKAATPSTLLRRAQATANSRPTHAAPSAALESTWFDAMKKWGDKPIAEFNPSTSFAIGDVFRHEVFGKGIVQSRRENKIEVLFQVGMKTLPSATAQRP